MNDLTVVNNRLKVIIEDISDSAGPIKDNCSVIKEIIEKIANTYRLK